MNILRWVLLFNKNLSLLVNILECRIQIYSEGLEINCVDFWNIHMTLEYNLNYESQ